MPPLIKVALIANQYFLDGGVSVLLDFCQPALYSLEGRPVSDVVHDHYAICPAVVAAGYIFEPVLSGRVPLCYAWCYYLHLDTISINVQHLQFLSPIGSFEYIIHANCVVVAGGEFVLVKTHKKA